MAESTRRELIKRLAILAAAGYAAPQVLTIRDAEAKKKKKKKKNKGSKKLPPNCFPGTGHGVHGDPGSSHGDFPGQSDFPGIGDVDNPHHD